MDEVVLVLGTERDHRVHGALRTGDVAELELTSRQLSHQRYSLDSDTGVAVRALLVEPHAKNVRLEQYVVERRRAKTKEHDSSAHSPFADNRRGLLAHIAKHWHTDGGEEARRHRDALHEADGARHRRLVHEFLVVIVRGRCRRRREAAVLREYTQRAARCRHQSERMRLREARLRARARGGGEQAQHTVDHDDHSVRLWLSGQDVLT